MVNVNYGEHLSPTSRKRIARLLQDGGVSLNTGMTEDELLKIIDLPGDKMLHISTGSTIEEAAYSLPANQGERIARAAVIIKVEASYQFEAPELVPLIKYFDVYPQDPKITWKYSVDPKLEEPVKIIILKILSA